jgi:hypothetical protein
VSPGSALIARRSAVAREKERRKDDRHVGRRRAATRREGDTPEPSPRHSDSCTNDAPCTGQAASSPRFRTVGVSALLYDDVGASPQILRTAAHCMTALPRAAPRRVGAHLEDGRFPRESGDLALMARCLLIGPSLRGSPLIFELCRPARSRGLYLRLTSFPLPWFHSFPLLLAFRLVAAS